MGVIKEGLSEEGVLKKDNVLCEGLGNKILRTRKREAKSPEAGTR